MNKTEAEVMAKLEEARQWNQVHNTDFNSIQSAIIDKGVPVPDTDARATYEQRIMEIVSDGGDYDEIYEQLSELIAEMEEITRGGSNANKWKRPQEWIDISSYPEAQTAPVNLLLAVYKDAPSYDNTFAFTFTTTGGVGMDLYIS